MRVHTYPSEGLTERPEIHSLGQAAPAWGLLYAVEDFPIAALREAFRSSFPDTPLIGATSFRGVFSGQRFVRGAALLLSDESDGIAAASALRVVGAEGARVAARSAAEQVKAALGRVPGMIILHATPGFEEAVVLGIVDALGTNTEVYGGSAGDDHISGNWQVFTESETTSEGFALAGLCTRSDRATLHGGFLGGYLPTGKRGVVTRATGRVVSQIDGEPAALVYNRWTGGVIAAELRTGGGNVLLKTNLHPLGRVIELRGGVPQRLLSHPHQVYPDGSLGLFTEVAVGDCLELMIGTAEPLVERAAKVVSRAIGRAEAELVGGLLVYCGGCLSAVLDRANDIAGAFDGAIGHAPYVGVATFGEQGCFLANRSKTNRHGNLMCSSVLFGRLKSAPRSR